MIVKINAANLCLKLKISFNSRNGISLFDIYAGLLFGRRTRSGDENKHLSHGRLGKARKDNCRLCGGDFLRSHCSYSVLLYLQNSLLNPQEDFRQKGKE